MISALQLARLQAIIREVAEVLADATSEMCDCPALDDEDLEHGDACTLNVVTAVLDRCLAASDAADAYYRRRVLGDARQAVDGACCALGIDPGTLTRRHTKGDDR